MNWWDSLEIDPHSDLKAIKQAYAAKLKVTKPDQDPEGFKRLHQAYKAACGQHKKAKATPNAFVVDKQEREKKNEREGQPPTPPEQDSPLPTFVLNPEPMPLHQASPQPSHLIPNKELPEQPQGTELEMSEEQLMQALKQTLNNPAQVNDLQHWSKLASQPVLVNLDVKPRVTLAFSQLLIAHLESSRRPIHHTTLAHLDHYFLWHRQRAWLESKLDHQGLDILFAAFLSKKQRLKAKLLTDKIHQGHMRYAPYGKKLLAGALDLTVFVAMACGLLQLCSALVDWFDWQKAPHFYVLLAWYLLYWPIAECSALQATPGKLLMGFKVVGRSGRRLNFFHALWRTLMFSASTAAFKLTVWINAFINDGRMLHDRLSGSLVIQR